MIDKRLTSFKLMLLSGILSLPFGPAMAATQAQSTQPTIVRGTISDVAGNKLKVTESNGKTDDVSLTNDARIAVVSSASLSDIKPDSYVGVAASLNPTAHWRPLKCISSLLRCAGRERAPELGILGAGSSMTNGTVAKVETVSGNKLTVSYRGGEKTISIGPSTKIVARRSALAII